tara:strand:- start:287 stop:700 length:414 start_codon:yes stop_codon:yes gene_type:complete
MVCTGNICRSPYAEFALAKKIPGIIVSSAGLSALVNKGADATGLAVARERGIDMKEHVAKQLNTSTVTGSDLILVMDDDHLRHLLRRYPEARGKTFKIGKWMGDKNIVDPFQKPASFFALVYDEIDSAIETWLKHLQ